MGMQVNTNIAANNAYRNLATTQNDLSKSLEKLSSGLRINRAADDAAGLAISEGLKSQVGGLTVASRNAQDAISVIQTAEGSLNEVTSILQRMRDLAVQAGNDSNNEESRTAIKTEADALTDELTRISAATNFNGTDLLNGDVDGLGGSVLSFQIGASELGSSRIAVDLEGADVTDVVGALSGVGGSDKVNGTVKLTGVTLADPAEATALSFTQGGVAVSIDVTAVASRTAADIATALNTANTSAGGTFTFAAEVDGTLTVTSSALNESNIDASGTGLGAGAGAAGSNEIVGGTAAVAPTGGLNFMSSGGASDSIEILDEQIAIISAARADLGANQNRFESVIKNLAVSKENLTAAGSRIRDTDMAEEMVKYTRANILSQAGTAMLAQANQSNSGVLQLLQ